jgi:hypothetical protein
LTGVGVCTKRAGAFSENPETAEIALNYPTPPLHDDYTCCRRSPTHVIVPTVLEALGPGVVGSLAFSTCEMSFVDIGTSLLGTVGPHTNTVVLCLEGVVSGDIRGGMTEGKEEPINVVPVGTIDEVVLSPTVSVALDRHEDVVVGA